MEEKTRKKKRRRAYLDDFQPDLNGNYVYRGRIYRWAAPERSFRQERRFLLAVTGAIAAGVIASGCTPAPGMNNCLYLLLPYIAELSGAFSLLCAMAQLGRREELRAYVYDASVKPLPRRAVLTAAAAALVLLAHSVFLAVHGLSGRLAATLGFWAMQLAVGALSLLLYRRVRAQRWEVRSP